MHFLSCIFFSGLEIKEPIKGKNKKLLEKIVDYMKSDSDLYASVFDSQPIVSSSKGSYGYFTVTISNITVILVF